MEMEFVSFIFLFCNDLCGICYYAEGIGARVSRLYHCASPNGVRGQWPFLEL